MKQSDIDIIKSRMTFMEKVKSSFAFLYYVSLGYSFDYEKHVLYCEIAKHVWNKTDE